jgi:hypothetical protein
VKDIKDREVADMIALVTENNLDEWVRGHAEDAQGVVVELIARLVAASCPKPRERRFPLGDSIGQHGPDGILVVDLSVEPFVPEGRSIWEIGTGLKAGDKATSDYNDRTADVPKDVREESTFIFVTPLSGRRDWEHTWKEEAQAAWLQKRRSSHEWKDVRVIDGTKLIDWILKFPPVELWFAEKLFGLQAPQIKIPEQHWAVLRSFGEPPPLIPRVFLANRDEAGRKLKEIFDGSAVKLKLATHFPDQAIDFVCAYLASVENETRIDTAGRCLIVSRTDAWNTLCDQWRDLILVADVQLNLSGDEGTKLIQKARKAGHAVIFCGPHGGLPDPASVQLPLPSSHELQQALEQAGYPEQRARTLAARSGRNLGSLLRLLQNLSVLPEWAQHTDAAELTIAAVLGSWTDNSEADRAIVEGLAGKAYGEWIRKMREIAVLPFTPLTQRGGNWKFVMRYEGWYALGSRIFDEHLDRLFEAAVLVLQQNDPQFELPAQERYAARLHGKVLPHSQLLREGLAESLALLGSHPQALTSCTLGKAESTAIRAVRQVLADADWVRWASLDDFLPLLAEAAPGEFLSAVERTLRSDPCPFNELLAQESGGVLGRTYMSGLLWALETLAWDADHLARVMLCLGELAARDPGGQWANRPANSLTTILLPWFPQTCAPIEKRMAAVKALLAELPDIGWKLLLTLLPKFHGASSGARRPAWRTTIPDDWRAGVTNKEYWEQTIAYSELAIDEAQKEASKLVALIDHLENLPQPAHERILEYLASGVVIAMPESEKLRLWNELIDLVTRHRKFADAQWAMNPQQVEKISVIADRLAPDAPFFRHQRLFSERDFDLYEEKENIEEQYKELENRRQSAVEEVSANGGIEAVLAFAKSVQSPWRVGIAFGVVAGEDADGVILPGLLDQKSLAQFVGAFVLGRFHSRGWRWVDSIVTAQWLPDQVGQFLSFLPFTHDTWERAKRLLPQDESPYWSKTAANPFEAERDLELAIDKLIDHGRPHAAVRCIYMLLRRKQPFDTRKAAQALVEALKSSEPHGPDAHEIVEIIKALQNDHRTNTDDLFRVEWAYLPLLNELTKASPKFIERRLANEPGFFCEVIRLVFRSKKEDRQAEELSDDKKKIGTNAYRLLNGWRTPPGLREDGTYDGDALNTWLEAVKTECRETGHLEIAMTMVGHVLVHVPPDPDGLWINRSAAAVLNAKDASDMRDGFRSQLYNSRGVHWVDPTGKPEKDLAIKYQAEAEAVDQAGFPRLAATLRDLAETYEREAERVLSREPFDD